MVSGPPRKRRQPVERALQDEDRGVFVDHLGAARAADVHADQFALDRGGGEPLVPQRNGEFGEFGEIARECPGRLRARPLAGVHVDGQAEHEADRVALGGNGDQFRRIGLERGALDGLHAGRQPAIGVGDRNPDGLGAEIEADQRAAFGPVRGGIDQG